MRIRIWKLAVIAAGVFAALVTSAFADVRTYVEYREGGTLKLEVAGVPLEVVLSDLDEHPEIEIKVLGSLSESLIALRAEGDLKDVLEQLLDGYSFVLDYGPSKAGQDERLAKIYILSAAADAPISTRSDSNAAGSDQVAHGSTARHAGMYSVDSPVERAHFESEALMQHWNTAQEKADHAHKSFREEQWRRRQGLD